MLAVGAWRDRPLPLSGVDRYVGRGLAYQNPFVYWFNHYPEPDYRGPQVRSRTSALVIGGGLASLDVVKILMLETVTRALAAGDRRRTSTTWNAWGLPASSASGA